MKFMDKVMTPNGPGLVIGVIRGERVESGVLVTIARKDLVGRACRGPCANLIFKDREVTNPYSSHFPSAAPAGGGRDRDG